MNCNPKVRCIKIGTQTAPVYFQPDDFQPGLRYSKKLHCCAYSFGTRDLMKYRFTKNGVVFGFLLEKEGIKGFTVYSGSGIVDSYGAEKLGTIDYSDILDLTEFFIDKLTLEDFLE